MTKMHLMWFCAFSPTPGSAWMAGLARGPGAGTTGPGQNYGRIWR